MSAYIETSGPWGPRINNANNAYKAWEDKFKCKRLEDYYENFQWKARTDGPNINYNPYTLNLVHSTIEIKLASFLFQRPSFIVTPEPGHAHWDLDFAVQGAQLKQDLLNTIIKNKNVNFTRHLKLAALDSYFRFAVIEIGYAADWRNPQKEDPYLKSWEDPSINEDKDRTIDDNTLPINERFYIKRIKPQRFRVAVSDSEDLNDFEWVGYYQYYYEHILRKTKGIKFPTDTGGSYVSSDFSGDITNIGNYYKDEKTGLFTQYQGAKICKVWHIWDNVAHKRRMLLEDDNYSELWSDDFDSLPLVDLRWHLRLNGFYPIPPVWYWLSAQDEINESREQIRSYRRRFTRKFQAVKGQIDEEEIEKFVSGPDGVVVEVKQVDAIRAIDNPEIGPTSENALIQAKDDFNIVSGTSAEARGQNADRETATQAKLVDARSQIRESAQQLDFSNFVCLVGGAILIQAQQKLADGMWVKMTANPSEGPLQDMQVNAPIIKWIKSQDINDGYDFTVEINIQNATPAAMQAEQQAFVSFVTFLSQQPMLAMSPVLIREAAYRFGYKNEQVIHQLQQVAVLSLAAKTAQASGQQGMTLQGAAQRAGNEGNPQAAELAKQMAQPTQQQIDTQITNQLQ